MHLSPNGAYNDMGSPDYREQFTLAAQELDSFGLAYLHVIDGVAFGFHRPRRANDVDRIPQGVPRAVNGQCGYTKEAAEEAISEGDADLISFGRPFISNPDLRGAVQERLAACRSGTDV